MMELATSNRPQKDIRNSLGACGRAQACIESSSLKLFALQGSERQGDGGLAIAVSNGFAL